MLCRSAFLAQVKWLQVTENLYLYGPSAYTGLCLCHVCWKKNAALLLGLLLWIHFRTGHLPSKEAATKSFRRSDRNISRQSKTFVAHLTPRWKGPSKDQSRSACMEESDPQGWHSRQYRLAKVLISCFPSIMAYKVTRCTGVTQAPAYLGTTPIQTRWVSARWLHYAAHSDQTLKPDGSLVLPAYIYLQPSYGVQNRRGNWGLAQVLLGILRILKQGATKTKLSHLIARLKSLSTSEWNPQKQ